MKCVQLPKKGEMCLLVRTVGEACGQISGKAMVMALIFLPTPPHPQSQQPLYLHVSNEWLPPISSAKNLFYLIPYKDQGRRLLISVTGGNFSPVAF